MTTDNENDLILQRRQDLKELRNTGVAYSNQFKRDSFLLIYILNMRINQKKILKILRLRFLLLAE